MRGARQAAARDRSFSLRHPRPVVVKTLRLTGVERHLDIETVEPPVSGADRSPGDGRPGSAAPRWFPA